MAERTTYGGKMYGVSCSTPLCPGSEPWPWCMDAEDAEKVWNTRSERTCRVVSSRWMDNDDIYPNAYYCELSCGHEVAAPYGLPSYCPECGSRIADYEEGDC